MLRGALSNGTQEEPLGSAIFPPGSSQDSVRVQSGFRQEAPSRSIRTASRINSFDNDIAGDKGTGCHVDSTAAAGAIEMFSSPAFATRFRRMFPFRRYEIDTPSSDVPSDSG